MIIGMICARPNCQKEISETRLSHGSPYCSKGCRRRMKPAYIRSQKERDRKRQAKRPSPYKKFEKATARRVQVKEGASSQEQARKLIAAKKVVAYENSAGVIRDIGVPKNPEKLGKVYSRRPKPVPVAPQ